VPAAGACSVIIIIMSVDDTDRHSIACSQRWNIRHCIHWLLSASAAAAAAAVCGIHTTGM